MTDSGTPDGQTFTLAEVHELYQSAYEDGVAAEYLRGERDGHDRALAEYLAELPEDAFEPRLPWVFGDEVRTRSANDHQRQQAVHLLADGREHL